MDQPNSATLLLHILAHLDEVGLLEVLQPAGQQPSILFVALTQWREEGRPTSTSAAPSAQEDELSAIEVLALLLDLYDADPGASDGSDADALWVRARELVVAAGGGEGA